MFTDAYNSVLHEEGGYVNDPADSGGATNRGITQATYDVYRASKKQLRRRVQYLTYAETEDIYKGIWKDCKADELPQGLNIMHFDFAVNAGNHRAAVTLQRCLGTTDDGIIGPKTLAAAWEKNSEQLIKAYAESRRGFYRSLAERRPKDKKFLNGWLKRTNRLETKSLESYRRATPNSRRSSV